MDRIVIKIAALPDQLRELFEEPLILSIAVTLNIAENDIEFTTSMELPENAIPGFVNIEVSGVGSDQQEAVVLAIKRVIEKAHVIFT